MRETRTSVAVEAEGDSEDLSKAWAKKVSGLGTNQGGVWVKIDVAQIGQTDARTQGVQTDKLIDSLPLLIFIL